MIGQIFIQTLVKNHTIPQLICSDSKSVAISETRDGGCAGVGGARDTVLDDAMTGGSRKFHCAQVGWAERTTRL